MRWLRVQVSVPVLLVFVVVGVGLVVLYLALPDEHGRKTLEFASAVLGGAAAIYTIMLNVQARRATAATRFIERWNSKDMTEVRSDIRFILDDAKQQKQLSTDRLQIINILNFFEEMAIAVLNGEADERIVKSFFEVPVLHVFRATEEWIKRQRSDLNIPTAYTDYAELYKRWEHR